MNEEEKDKLWELARKWNTALSDLPLEELYVVKSAIELHIWIKNGFKEETPHD